LGEVGLHPPFDILPESVEAILILAGALEPGSGGEEDADPSTADEVESLGMGNFVEETQDGAAKVGRRRGHGILERVKGHRRGPSDRWNKDQNQIRYEELSGIILPTRRMCPYRAKDRAKESLESGLTSGDIGYWPRAYRGRGRNEIQ